ncbi:uncharacterized protein LOC119587571 [Penaeus monodon]|uniref:uncharacterized protein LOC119587571 n=1 Tax=Penaeus monodon TaxID=6687 RepID=UPI0018A6DD66|nr:uncharacterized protein LOC119587571 [Penaeus monodon]
MVTFRCTEGLRREGVEGGRRRASGAIQCVKNLNGNWGWNDTLVLPCFMWCPDGFVSPKDGMCLHFSQDKAEFGLAEASLKCAAKHHSSLAKFQSLADLRDSEKDVFYYTQYTTDGSTMFPETIPSDFVCDSTFEQCQVGSRYFFFYENDRKRDQ